MMDGGKTIEVVINEGTKHDILSDAITVLGMLKSSTRLGSNWQSYMGEHWKNLLSELLNSTGVASDRDVVLSNCIWDRAQRKLVFKKAIYPFNSLLPESVVINIHCPPLHPFVDQIQQQCPMVTFWWQEAES